MHLSKPPLYLALYINYILFEITGVPLSVVWFIQKSYLLQWNLDITILAVTMLPV